MNLAAMMLVACLVDACLGWRGALHARIGHPVTWIGRLIALLDRRWNDGDRNRRLAAGALVTILIVGLVAGLAQVDMPGPVDTFIDFNGAAAPPIALFALGVVLSKTRMSADPVVLTVGAIKMLAFPALIWVVFAAVSPGWTPQSQQFILAAAGPAGAMAFSMALLYDVRADRIAQIIVGTSALTLLSLALVLTI